MSEIDGEAHRHLVRESLRAKIEGTLEGRLDRHIEVNHQNIVAAHHFAEASAECLDLYSDGHFFSTVMVSQSIAEGIFRFVLDKNSISADGRERPEMA